MLSGSTKTCTKCKEPKQPNEFYKRQASKDGLQAICKACDARGRTSRFARDLKRRYDLTPEAYAEMGEKQNWECAICSATENVSTTGLSKRFCVDHDHHTGEVRGLLCHSCNRGIGMLRDDPSLVMNAYKYLTARG